MKKFERPKTSLLKALGIGMAILPATGAQGGGYQIFEKSASDLGRAFAGNAAIADDASTIATNPAGMILLKKPQFSLAISTIAGRAEVDLEQSGVEVPGLGLRPSQGRSTSGNAAPENPVIPAAYGVFPLNEQIVFGFAAFSNFSTGTQYEQNFGASLLAIDSEITTVNLNPSAAIRINDQFSVGVGLNAVLATAKISSANPAIGPVTGPNGQVLLRPDGTALLAPTGGVDGYSEVAGDDWGFGWNLGVLYELNDDARLGLSYRSTVNMTLEGTTEFKGVSNPSLYRDFDAEAPLELPDILSLSGYWRFVPTWALSADVTWTGWSRFEDLKVFRKSDNALTSYTRENWDDGYRYALGLTNYFNQKLSLRAGLAYDESPIPNAYRTLRIPTQDMVWAAIGGQYQFSDRFVLDAGYAHVFMDEASINETREFAGQAFVARAVGDANVSLDIFSLQLSYLL